MKKLTQLYYGSCSRLQVFFGRAFPCSMVNPAWLPRLDPPSQQLPVMPRSAAGSSPADIVQRQDMVSPPLRGSVALDRLWEPAVDNQPAAKKQKLLPKHPKAKPSTSQPPRSSSSSGAQQTPEDQTPEGKAFKEYRRQEAVAACDDFGQR